MRTDVTPSMAGYAQALALAARQWATGLALSADAAITQAEAGGWMDGPTGTALAAADEADAALGYASEVWAWSWQADRILAAQAAPRRPVRTVQVAADAAREAEAG